ncbi:MerR family transcriptional regulator [Paenibacillus bovis]|uniref:MerR family transcriptional regulator n=1 Tax=Paenibacillus bovis TaxID=1616788 RepID=A0A172ZJK2_9BACL|nr:MerR family transcriptional regulator [Paenibacillus bovis]ANF97719.1 MerR family transcriptional regulator [Paenibacillus bovis]
MKNNYKISEISRLYHIGIDSLRYYEKLGILKPRRDTNGYRLYSLQDMYRLNIIRDLRQLNFSMQQIKEYLDHQSIDHTLELLHREQSLIQEQISQLQDKNHLLQARIEVLSAAARIHTGIFKIKKIPVRPCLQLSTRITRDEEMDFAIRKLHSRHEDRIRDFGNQLYAASVLVEELTKDQPVVFESVFFILEPNEFDYDFVLPAGDYLSVCYRGGYHQSAERIREILDYAEQAGLDILGSPFEIYEVDNRDSMREEEYVTEIQLRVAQKDKE